MAKKYVLDIWDCLFNATDSFEDYVLGIDPVYVFNPNVLERQTSDSYLFEFFVRALSNRNCDNLVFDLGNLSRHEYDTLRALSREAVPRKRLPQETADDFEARVTEETDMVLESIYMEIQSGGGIDASDRFFLDDLAYSYYGKESDAVVNTLMDLKKADDRVEQKEEIEDELQLIASMVEESLQLLIITIAAKLIDLLYINEDRVLIFGDSAGKEIELVECKLNFQRQEAYAIFQSC